MTIWTKWATRDRCRSNIPDGPNTTISGGPFPLLQSILSRFAQRHLTRALHTSAGQVAELLDQTARRCSSGESLPHAFAVALETSPLDAVFASASAAMRGGATIERALEQQSTVDADLALAVHALRLCAVHGGNVSESLDRAAATLRERDAIAQERVAQSAQARLSARVLTLLPIGFGGWTLLTTSSVQQFFLTPIGISCLSLGLLLNLTGWKLMSRVSRGSA